MASYLPLPISFQKSYIDRDSYPRNLIRRTVSTYPSALAAYATRLDFAVPNLFETDVKRLEVPIRDLQTDNGNGEGLSSRNCLPEFTLTWWCRIGKVEHSEARRAHKLVWAQDSPGSQRSSQPSGCRPAERSKMPIRVHIRPQLSSSSGNHSIDAVGTLHVPPGDARISRLHFRLRPPERSSGLEV